MTFRKYANMNVIMDSENQNIKSWIDRWKQTGSRLEEIRKAELQSPDYGEKLRSFGSMLNWACSQTVDRPTSGLVEQQRYFRKFR